MNRSVIIKKAMDKLGLKSVDFINESDKPDKITSKERKSMNNDFTKAGLDGNGRFSKLDQGINKINEILDKHSFELDEVTSSDKFRGDSGRVQLHFARKNKKDAHSPTSIKNSLIVFTWHKLGEVNVTDVVKDKTFEILAYIS